MKLERTKMTEGLPGRCISMELKHSNSWVMTMPGDYFPQSHCIVC